MSLTSPEVMPPNTLPKKFPMSEKMDEIPELLPDDVELVEACDVVALDFTVAVVDAAGVVVVAVVLDAGFAVLCVAIPALLVCQREYRLRLSSCVLAFRDAGLYSW
jgi:hypothetical protein